MQKVEERVKMQNTQKNDSKNPASKIYKGLNRSNKKPAIARQLSLSYFFPTTLATKNTKLITLALTTDGVKPQR